MSIVPRRQSKSHSARSWASSLEYLEPRVLLDAATSLWSESPNLTLSFAPDDIDIAGEPNRLTSFLDAQFPTKQWQEAILRAFQTWAVETQANIGFVAETEGHAFGAAGARTGDDRFGDIRVGARPLADDVVAVSVSQDVFVSGTWAGDVIFNSAINYSSVDELYSVALHEAGHVFGLEHNDRTESPLHVHGISQSIEVTEQDVAELRSLFGDRQADSYDQSHSNSTVGTASAVDLALASTPGASPSVVLADLAKGDVDTYDFDIPDGYQGPLTIRLRTLGQSLLSPAMNIYLDGTHVESRESSTLYGDILTVTLPNAANAESLVVQVAAAIPVVDTAFAVGRYSLMTIFDSLNQVDPDTIDIVESQRFAEIDEDDIDDFLADEDDWFEDDERSDDEFELAREITDFDDSDSIRRIKLLATLSAPGDADYYEVEVPDESTEKNTVLVAIRTLDGNRRRDVPELQVFTEDGEPRNAQTLVNDEHELVIQIEDLGADGEAVLSVTSPAGATEPVGNYELTVLFQKQPVQFESVLHGQLVAHATTASLPLNVATTELKHFVLEAQGPDGHYVDVEVFRGTDRVLSMRSLAGVPTSVPSRLFDTGAYRVEVSAGSAPLELGQAINFELRASTVSDPLGLLPTLPTDLEFSCPNVPDLFCYPGGIESDDPLLWDEFLLEFPGDTSLSANAFIQSQLDHWWQWYWDRVPGNNPPLARDDEYFVDDGLRLSVSRADGLTANDLDPNRDVLRTQLVTEPQSGVIQLLVDGSFHYTPDPGFVGLDEFEYQVFDGRVASAPARVTIETTTELRDGDFNGDGAVDAGDLDLLTSNLLVGAALRYDLNGDGTADSLDRVYMIRDILGTHVGDANLDRRFTTTDLVQVFQRGHYEVAPSESQVLGWANGDWNGDGRFDSADLVVAFQAGFYVG